MDESSNLAGNVARAITAALDWSSPPDTRKAAVAYLESVKGGDIRMLANISFLLVRKDWSSEIRLHGFKMLQHLVRLRWDELNNEERRNFANLAMGLISEIASPQEEWALKSQTAALVAEVVRREGISLWQELLPSLVTLSNTGPMEAELVVMMLRWLPEDITVHNEDLEGDRRRVLLRGLTQSLPEILPLLYNLLEKHFGAALNEAGRQQMAVAKQHAATVIAALNAINAYAEWAPVSDLSKHGLVHGCGFLLSSSDFRLYACEFFKLVSGRKRPSDSSGSEFDSAMSAIFQILMDVSQDFLNRCSSNGAACVDESEFEFAECICESMVSLGSFNLQCIAGDASTLTKYLQQMLGYFQHYKFPLHFQSLLFWLTLMRESVSKPKVVGQVGVDGTAPSNSVLFCQINKEKKGFLNAINDDVCRTMLDVSFQRMLKRNIQLGPHQPMGTLELWSEEFDGKGDFSQYRSRLVELIRLIASDKPIVAVNSVSQRIDAIIKSHLNNSVPPQDIPIMDSMQLALEAIVSVIFDGSADLIASSSETQHALRTILEGLLKQLIGLKWTEPTLAELLGRYIDALGPFLKHFSDAVSEVIRKLFELLTSLPYDLKDPSALSARHARLHICTSFIRIAKAADKSLLPHMKDIADTMAYLQGEGRLHRGEHNLLGEAFLIMASAAGIQQQQEVLAWLLEPLSKQWTTLEWQNAYLSDPLGLVSLCSDRAFMWSIYHNVTFFEKALKRSGIRKGSATVQNQSSVGTDGIPSHPMGPHLAWMLPPLLRLLRAVHSLWSLPVTQALPGDFRAAMSMNQVEQAGLLGEGNSKLPKNSVAFSDGLQIDEPIENDLRNWLKGIRDSGYNVLGLSATLGDYFFRCLEGSSVALSLVENIQSMEFRHIRQLVHLVLIPLVKFCPVDLWENWLANLLHPLFLHCQQALSVSWTSLLLEGRAKVPDNCGNVSGLELKMEVMEEKLLRDLTREICFFLSVLASPGLNSGLPAVEQSGHIRASMSSLKDLDELATNSLMGFLLRHKGAALPALQISKEAFSWTDGEAVAKVSSFCGAVVLLACLTNNAELREFATKDMFCAVLQGLTLESNAIISADLVSLCREIFVYLSERDSSPRQVLLSLPNITNADLQAFEEALGKTSSPKEQKQLMKSLLLLAAGKKLKALAAPKSTNVITNVSTRTRSVASVPASSIEGDEVVGLAAII
ncbi:hypothetical protein H6P81_002086 [Aristolochia fimbriata]|uniref:Protein HASTY 1 n=1 Tax=Aristolochia fimbriata TaxID=158543 RepID=A0AAV7FDD1_ARIFI|nr:hypothetical protein H6P81_002086 [Aristolochia fimbriata]